MRLEHHLVGGYVRYISPHIIIIIIKMIQHASSFLHLSMAPSTQTVSPNKNHQYMVPLEAEVWI